MERKIIQSILEEILDKKPSNKDELKNEILGIGARAARRFLAYQSAKGIYRVTNRLLGDNPKIS